MDTETAQVVKKGETCIEATFSRKGEGVFLRVKAHPIVEEYMKKLGNGDVKDVDAIGQGWVPVAGAAPLQFYHMTSGKEYYDPYASYSLEHIGNKLYLPHPDGSSKQVLNLAFLRLRGISEGTGVEFKINVPSSLEQLRKVRDELRDAFKNLYVNYIRPVEIGVVISNIEQQF